jgi:4-amino-4-deoxy-L-arabinose transferase-like glycosyltransferase
MSDMSCDDGSAFESSIPTQRPRGSTSEGAAPFRLTRDDLLAAVGLSILFAAILTGTWDRWTHPMVDHGREMNLPARILAGERLYVDIIYYYGPLGPYFNAFLYKLFGTNVATLHASGMVCAAIVISLIYWLARHLLSPIEAALAAALVLVTCAVNPNLASYVQPYAYAALYGFTLSLSSLACVVRFVWTQNTRFMFWAGVCIGGAAACKPELAVLGIFPSLIAWALVCMAHRRWTSQPIWLVVAPAVAISLVTYLPIVLLVPWQMLFTDIYEAFRQPQMMYFAHNLDGIFDWPDTGWAVFVGLGMTLAAWAPWRSWDWRSIRGCAASGVVVPG